MAKATGQIFIQYLAKKQILYLCWLDLLWLILGLRSTLFTRRVSWWEGCKWRPEYIWGIAKKVELENGCEALVKEMVIVTLSFTRCLRTLSLVDQDRQERLPEEKTAWERHMSGWVSLQAMKKLSSHTNFTFYEVIWGQRTVILLRMPGEFCRSSKSWWIYNVLWTECPNLLTDSPNTDFKIKWGAKNIGLYTVENQGGWERHGSDGECSWVSEGWDSLSELGEDGKVETFLPILVLLHEIGL